MENCQPSVVRQLSKEVKELLLHPPEGIRIVFNESNLADIQAYIDGPVDTPYAGGSFHIKLHLGSNYPNEPPKGYFITKIFHPNIAPQTGEICVNTLKRDWTPDTGLKKLLLVIKCLLIVPNPESALNEDAGRLLLEEYSEYFARARLYTEIHALKCTEGGDSAAILKDSNENGSGSDSSKKPSAASASSTGTAAGANAAKSKTKKALKRFRLRLCSSSGGGGCREPQPVVVRFAPSPTGRMHVGGARTALVNFAFAKRHSNGRFLLRLEDTDAKRCKPEAASDILESLDWLGLRPDNADSVPVQSNRLDKYRDAAARLVDSGLAYPCFCSEHRLELLRRHQRAAGQTPGYDGKCRLLTADERQQLMAAGERSPVIRFNMRAAAARLLPSSLSSSSSTSPSTIRVRDLLLGDLSFPLTGMEADPVLLKSDGWPVYHLASVFDDRCSGVTHVIRGREWLPSAPKHVLLRAALDSVLPSNTDAPPPPSSLLFAHLPLLLDWRDGAKLSKRKGGGGGGGGGGSSGKDGPAVATEIRELRALGYLPEAVIDWLVSATWTGRRIGESSAEQELTQQSPAKTLSEFCSAIELTEQCLASRDARLDPAALRSAGLRSLTPELASTAAIQAVRDRLALADGIEGSPSDAELHRCLATLRGRLATLFDVDSHSYLFRAPDDSAVWQGLAQLLSESAAAHCTADSLALSAMDLLSSMTSSSLPTGSVKKPSPLHFKAARLLMTGQSEGPSVREIFHHLGSDEVHKRLIKFKQTNMASPAAGPNVKVGNRVEVSGKNLRGTVAFVGTTQFSAGKWVGVALDESQGKNDGSVNGKRYFTCPENHGLFVRQTQLTVLPDSKPTSGTPSKGATAPSSAAKTGTPAATPSVSKSRESLHRSRESLLDEDAAGGGGGSGATLGVDQGQSQARRVSLQQQEPQQQPSKRQSMLIPPSAGIQRIPASQSSPMVSSVKQNS
uniref:E2 ubiquitin-conjugating enzyme n=1 Tax=Macrostomum lignano TaxID=282301 RepID=A0A1I8G0L6_9PLAT